MLANLISYFIVWNIGQGQFTTAIDSKNCQHFDVGGEINVMSQVKRLCFSKMNFIYLSHWDMDHIGFVLEFQKKQFRHCVIPPKAIPTKKFAKKVLQSIRICKAGETHPRILPNLIYSGSASRKASTNDQSMVYQFQNILIPGDSTSAQEKIWSSTVRNIDYLILGHHGSKTSTSNQLLKSIPRTYGAICSARKNKYNHPHFQVIQSLKQRKIPLLRTEDWGHLMIEIKKARR